MWRKGRDKKKYGRVYGMEDRGWVEKRSCKTEEREIAEREKIC